MILIDTGPLVALCDPHDSHHDRALDDLEALATAPLVTCQAVLTEACFHLPAALQRKRLDAWINELSIEPLPAERDPSFTRDVFAWLARYAEHEPDWADGCLAVRSGRELKAKVWTYDREFQTTWRRPDGTSIPLALAHRGARRRR